MSLFHSFVTFSLDKVPTSPPQGIPGRDQGPATGPDAVAPPVSGTPATPVAGISLPANTGSSPTAGGGK